MGGTRKYERPPVRRTVLTVYFDPVENFDLEMITRLHSRWSERYPASQQSFPETRPDELPTASPFRAAFGGFPAPAVLQISRSLSRTISYQYDQISFSWQFDPEAPDNTYPGFEALSKELHSNFEFFADVVEKFADKPLKVQGGQCYYDNELANTEGVDWISGYLSNWTGTVARNRLEGAEYVGFRWRNESDNERLGTHRVTKVQLDSGTDWEETEIDINVLSLPLEGSQIEGKPPTEQARLLLDDAHDLEISTFEKLINDELRASWGKSDGTA